MESSQMVAANLELAESLRPLELELESGSLRATYDSTRDSTSLAVVAVVATALGSDPQNMTPLHAVIDTDALDKLTMKSASDHGNSGSISFSYEGFEVTVTDAEVIEVNPIKSA